MASASASGAATTAAPAPAPTSRRAQAADRRLAKQLALQLNQKTRRPRRGPAAPREPRPTQVKAQLHKLIKKVLRPDWLKVEEVSGCGVVDGMMVCG